MLRLVKTVAGARPSSAVPKFAAMRSKAFEDAVRGAISTWQPETQGRATPSAIIRAAGVVRSTLYTKRKDGSHVHQDLLNEIAELEKRSAQALRSACDRSKRRSDPTDSSGRKHDVLLANEIISLRDRLDVETNQKRRAEHGELSARVEGYMFATALRLLLRGRSAPDELAKFLQRTESILRLSCPDRCDEAVRTGRDIARAVEGARW